MVTGYRLQVENLELGTCNLELLISKPPHSKN
jgi:hypothetical protein